MAKRKSKPKKIRGPHGEVGPQTYDQVRKIVDERKLPMGKAFEEVANATGRKASTVAVTYYRISRLKNGPQRKRRVARAKQPTGARRGRKPGGGSGSGAKSVLSRVSADVKELETLIAHQAQEIVRLRKESGLADRIRRALRE